MNELTTQKTMTTKELSDLWGIPRQTIANAVNKLDKVLGRVLTNSQGGWLFTQEQATLIMTELKKHHNLSNREIDKMATDYEMELLTEKVIAYHVQKKNEYKQRMEVAEKRVETLEATIEEQKPAVDFFKTVTGSSDTFDMKTVSKVLNKDIGRNKLFALLRNHNVLDKNNQPYQTYIDRGYFRVIESSFVDKYLITHINLKTVVYQKGVDFINKLIEKEVANG